MTRIQAPKTKTLMAKYGVKRWTMIHNTSATRKLMGQLFDKQFANVTDFDCFSQCYFADIEQYKAMKRDPVYLERLKGEHEVFADTTRSCMTIGWVEDFIMDGEVIGDVE
ncbi:MAG: hypothetical protein Q9164_001645 [Protoblastenia rupestris]